MSAPRFIADSTRRGDGIVLDALPYGDLELDEPGMREIVNALILDEMSRYPGVLRGRLLAFFFFFKS